ncbi:hypothetical protein ES332_A03G196800v1 [Gossypium tomentosum]|uniref:Uncharacterized protein n=1 Tax=Gossypium tomentosum TaxID=34277 RepID=A0A5D2R8Z7_GOSTO|nr:hypothetical protein ES332_A03G196800v1 [Gossypium tomentosum]
MILDKVKINFEVLHLAMQNRLITATCGLKNIAKSFRSRRERDAMLLQEMQHPKCFSSSDTNLIFNFKGGFGYSRLFFLRPMEYAQIRKYSQWWKHDLLGS